MSEPPIELTPDLLDDFYAECEEQLSTIRDQLTVLESAAGNAPTEQAALERIYRSIHSFKGNAAIVGLAVAEQLAHAAENVLRRLTREKRAPAPGTADLLGQTAHRLEQVVAAFQSRAPLPEIGDLLRSLEQGDVAEVAQAGDQIAVEPEPATRGATSTIFEWTAEFRPSTELEARGVSVNTVRQRLADGGRILSAKPQVEPGGNVRFDFVVQLNQSPVPADWTEYGVTWTGSAVVPEPAEARATPPDIAAPASHIVRVDLARLDELMRIAGEMVIHRSRLQDRIAQLPGDGSALQEVNLGLMRSLRDLRQGIMRVRLVPIVEIFSRLPFVVRDLTRGTEKRVRLVLEGQDTEVDKHIVERLREPLLHLVRNAVSHGVESAEERAAAGKPAEATLLLKAQASGAAVEIHVRDDGAGVDATTVADRARTAGMAVPEMVDSPALLKLLCIPGFSTRNEADRAAGRGVGMAVVEATVRELGGTLSLHTEPGHFTEFVIRLPLTLSIADAFIVSVGTQRCAVPQGSVDEVVQIAREEVHPVNGRDMAPHRGTMMPVVWLRTWFGQPLPSSGTLPALVIATAEGRTALAVDRVLGQREIVIRPIQDPLLRVPGLAGATELGDGQPVLILDAATITYAAEHRSAPESLSAAHTTS